MVVGMWAIFVLLGAAALIMIVGARLITRR